MKFELKIGQLEYALVKYEKVIRVIIPITNNNYYLLISVDIEETDFDRIIMKEINPLWKARNIILILRLGFRIRIIKNLMHYQWYSCYIKN